MKASTECCIKEANFKVTKTTDHEIRSGLPWFTVKLQLSSTPLFATFDIVHRNHCTDFPHFQIPVSAMSWLWPYPLSLLRFDTAVKEAHTFRGNFCWPFFAMNEDVAVRVTSLFTIRHLLIFILFKRLSLHLAVSSVRLPWTISSNKACCAFQSWWKGSRRRHRENNNFILVTVVSVLLCLNRMYLC